MSTMSPACGALDGHPLEPLEAEDLAAALRPTL